MYLDHATSVAAGGAGGACGNGGNCGAGGVSGAGGAGGALRLPRSSNSTDEPISNLNKGRIN